MSAANALAAAKQSPWPGLRYQEIAASLRSSQRRFEFFKSAAKQSFRLGVRRLEIAASLTLL
jgi:hypothetical protein